MHGVGAAAVCADVFTPPEMGPPSETTRSSGLD